MTRFSTLAAGTALATTLFATQASADLTAQTVWGDLKEYLQTFGYAITATESLAGDTLTVTNIVLDLPMPEDDVAVSMTLDSLTYTTQDDGSVAISVPETSSIVVNVEPEDDDAVRIGMDMTTSKFGISVAGEPDDMTYTYDLDDLALTLTEVVIKGANAVPGIISFQMSASDLDGTNVMRKGAAREISQSFAFGDLSYDLKFDDPESDDQAQVSAKLADVALSGDMTMPLQLDTSDPLAFFKGGFDVAATYSAGPGSTSFNVSADGELISGAMSSTSSTFSFAMQDQVIGYGLEGTGQDVAVQGGELPFPVQFAMDRLRFEFAFPLGQKDEPQPFGLGLTLGNFTMADLLWSIFDPAGQLPRNPATIDLDIIGTAKLLVDLFDEDTMEAIDRGELVPGELQTLSLENLVLDAVGTRLLGSGSFTFDNSDTQTYDGFPKPVGAVDLELSGSNALIDTLVNMGLLPQEQAMGARMMMSMFANSAGNDVLKSKIEMNEQGQVLANGQRLR